MSENAKKAALVVAIIVALVAVGFSARGLFAEEQMVIEGGGSMPPGFKSEKERALEEQARTGGKNPPPFPERKRDDVSGG
ncbi:MAG: hypothetical protein ACO1SV_27370 [Fimbriimonas sp.]